MMENICTDASPAPGPLANLTPLSDLNCNREGLSVFGFPEKGEAEIESFEIGPLSIKINRILPAYCADDFGGEAESGLVGGFGEGLK